jgi:hypothetical protein
MILFSGNVRPILPVIPKSTTADELNAYLKSSFSVATCQDFEIDHEHESRVIKQPFGYWILEKNC